MMKTPKSRFSLILLLGLLSALGPFSIDMYLPGFPVIAADLQTSVDRVSYSLSSYFVGVCVGQMLWGPLLDRFGRKRPLYIGLVIYILASLGCAVAGSIEMLIGFRFLQALGGCVGMVAPRAVVRDVFPVSENAKVFSLLILVIGVSPIIAPTAGSFFITAFGWHSVFLVLAVMSVLLLLAVIFSLPESKQPDPSFSLRPKPIVNKFLFVLKDPQFYTYALTGAVASAGLYAYLSGSPYVFMELFDVSEQQYSWIFAIVAGGLIASSQLNNLLLKKHSSEQIIRTVLTVQVTVGLLLAIGTAAGLLNLYTTIFLIFLFLCCQGFSFPNASALSMAPFSKEAGSASALMGAIQMGMGAVASALVGVFFNGTALPMTGVMAGCALSALLILSIGSRKIRYKSRQADINEQAFDMVEKY
ncbi:MAG TPA: multidrug effflux MFS transporter [Flavisolibacter sp.]|jgi:DHA1 family bicyclomycin/chloramphenicol resistance-like MFS transporter|nr:multidrug effflux MFS transporter [Flavisolibacter sp.]